jgi:hypothetical protein
MVYALTEPLHEVRKLACKAGTKSESTLQNRNKSSLNPTCAQITNQSLIRTPQKNRLANAIKHIRLIYTRGRKSTSSNKQRNRHGWSYAPATPCWPGCPCLRLRHGPGGHLCTLALPQAVSVGQQSPTIGSVDLRRQEGRDGR